jgi:rSAM/selenodomain-associated transferase 1
MINDKNALIVFIKTPVPNQVKTRLQPHLTGEEACRLYGAFLKDIDNRLNQNSDFAFYYAISPENFNKEILKKHTHLSHYFMQEGSDLGERMANAFSHLFAKGFKNISLIGSDVPTLTSDIVTEAFKMLTKTECVLGPGLDGGYYLLGMSRYIPDIFQGISWSTSSVFNQTMAILSKKDIKVKTLQPMRDIDTANDLTPLYQELMAADRNSDDFPIHTWEVLRYLKFLSQDKA